MMLKSMRDASESDGELDSNETSMYQDMFDKQVALTLSKHQDLGIARLFERQLGPKAIAGAPAPAPQPRRRRPRPSRRQQADADDGSNASGRECEHRAAARRNSSVKCCRPFAAPLKGLGVNPLGLLAQAALETGWGQRMPRTADGSSEPQYVRHQSGRGVERRAGRRGHRGIQRRRCDAAAHRVSRLWLDRGERQRLRQFAREARRVIAVRLPPAAMRRRTSRTSPKSGYATDPEYGNKLNQILNSSTLRTALKGAVAAL